MAMRKKIVGNAGIGGERPRHSTSPGIHSDDFTVALVGQPNVGKSVIMNLLTGAGAVVSDYSGTTVEITQGHFLYGTRKIRVIDTPGTYSLHSDTEEQKVTQRVLLEGNIDLIVNVADARNLSRNLYLTMQLMDLGIPMVLVLNQMDMAGESGMQINTKLLSEVLQFSVIPMIASKGEGLDRLTKAIADCSVSCSGEFNAESGPTVIPGIENRITPLVFSDPVEEVIEMLQGHIEELIPEEDGKHRLHPSRALAIHLMEHDSLDEDLFVTYPELSDLVEQLQISAADGNVQCHGCLRGCRFCPARDESHPNLPTCLERTQRAQEIALTVTKRTLRDSVSLRGRIERFLDQPSTGIPALGLIAYLSLKLILVILDFAESFVPWAFEPVVSFIESIAGSFPNGSLAETIFSAIPEGILLPFEVVMPTMLSIYFIMALLEDSGLMPRIAIMMDRAMSLLKLPGQSIIPIVLGFGCRAPGVLATRALPGRSSRLIVTALLAIPIPCAATLGIIAGVGKSFGADLKIVYGSITLVFVLLSRVLAHFLKSNQELILEVPPVQIPSAKRVGAKVWMRFQGFFKEVLPVLMITGIGVKILLNTEMLSGLARLDPISVKLFGVTGQSLAAVAVTVVQRYAAPMALLNLPLGPREATIAASMISLSMPCLPMSFLINREFGWKTLAAIFSIAMAISLGSGIVLNLILPAF
ncbi:MAG: ferrous iron transport protein B [Bacillota bacterium]|jgi:ferrous iron transport protein B